MLQRPPTARYEDVTLNGVKGLLRFFAALRMTM